MARDFERRPTAESIAESREAESEEEGPKLSTGLCVVLVVACLILDIANYFEVEIPITDLVFAWMINIILIYKGVSITRYLVGEALEIIPIVDLLPLYTIGIIATIVADRTGIEKALDSSAVGKVVSKVQSVETGGAGGVAKGAVKAQSSKLAKNKVFGSASSKYVNKIQDLQRRIPGRIRSVPEGQESGGLPLPPGKSTGTGSRIFSAAKSAYRTASSGVQDANDSASFLDTYPQIQRQINPELEDILAEIDVTGEKVAAEAAARAASVRDSSKQV
jgi:hypothetical protein